MMTHCLICKSLYSYVEISTYYSQIHNIMPLCLYQVQWDQRNYELTVHSFTTNTETKAWATIYTVIINQFLDSFNKLSDRRTGIFWSSCISKPC